MLSVDDHLQPNAQLEKAKILVVDDVKENLIATEALLKRDDLEIYMARSGREALELLMVHEFALSLLDIMMPEMSGFELAELMRGSSRTRQIPIIFMTATAKSESFVFKGYESGAVDYLYKPFDEHSLKNKVNIFIELYHQKKVLKDQLDELTRARKEQAILLDKLTQTQTELEKAVRIRDEFMSMASHELKTPLTTLKLQSQLRMLKLKKGEFVSTGFDQLKEMFEIDSFQLDRITHLIDDMLDISRINTGKLIVNPERFDLCEMVSNLVERNIEQLKLAECEVIFSGCEPAVGEWDRFRIEQVITNLLTNAMKYGAGKPVHISIMDFPDRVKVSVRDYGRGIAKEDHERIFERFERVVVNNQSNQSSGLGLGLYIVRQIVDAHKGKVWVESSLGQGSDFLIELPYKISTEH